MPAESYAETVARMTSAMETIFMAAVESVPDRGERNGMIKAYSAALAEVERRTLHRMQASNYEYQRREGQRVGNLGKLVAPRGATA